MLFQSMQGPALRSRGCRASQRCACCLQEELAKDEPVTINGATTSTWTVYTDGAFEPDGEVRASVGGSACQTGWSGDGVLRFEAA